MRNVPLIHPDNNTVFCPKWLQDSHQERKKCNQAWIVRIQVIVVRGIGVVEMFVMVQESTETKGKSEIQPLLEAKLVIFRDVQIDMFHRNWDILRMVIAHHIKLSPFLDVDNMQR